MVAPNQRSSTARHGPSSLGVGRNSSRYAALHSATRTRTPNDQADAYWSAWFSFLSLSRGVGMMRSSPPPGEQVCEVVQVHGGDAIVPEVGGAACGGVAHGRKPRRVEQQAADRRR